MSLRTDPATPGPLREGIADISAGLVVGFNLALRLSALAMLIYFGPFASGLYPGLTALIALSVCLSLGLLLARGMPRIALGAAQDAPIAVLMPTLYLWASSLDPAHPPEVALATLMAVLGCTALLSAIAFFSLAWFDLARLVRLLPFPVVAGYLASTGAILIWFALRMTGIAPDPDTIAQPDAFLLPLVLALAAFALMRGMSLWNAGLGPVLAIALSLGAFTLWSYSSGLPTAELRAMGLLPAAVPGDAQTPLHPGLLRLVDWGFMQTALPSIGIAAAIATLGAMLNITGVELITRTDLPYRKALANSGLINAAFACFGASPGYLSASTTSVGRDMGGRSALMTISTCATLLLALIFAQSLMTEMPIFLFVGVLLLIGWSVLREWLLGQFFKLSPLDSLQICAIVAVALMFGMVQALGLGIIIASLTFAITYGRLPVIRRESTLASGRSTVDRGPAATAILDQHGHKVATIELQGFLFFGSAEQLVQIFRSRVRDTPELTRLILDFSAVSGFDSASIEALRKLEYLAASAGKTVVLSGLSKGELLRLRKSRLSLTGGAVSICSDLDTAREEAETSVLASAPDADLCDDARSALARAGLPDTLQQELLDMMERQWLAKGTRLIHAGATDDRIYLIESGRLAIETQLPSGNRLRIRSLRAGAFVGEIASYAELARTADVIAEEPSVVYGISPGQIETLSRSRPDLAVQWHKMIARTLADKIDRNNRLLRDRA